MVGIDKNKGRQDPVYGKKNTGNAGSLSTAPVSCSVRLKLTVAQNKKPTLIPHEDGGVKEVPFLYDCEFESQRNGTSFAGDDNLPEKKSSTYLRTTYF